MPRFTTIDQLQAAVGQEFPPGPWNVIDQPRVSAFADVTDDHQWIHIDVDRARASEFGGTIVHGYLTLSLLSALGADVVGIDLPGAMLNYGLNRARFPAPVPTGSRVRAHVKVLALEARPPGQLLTLGYELEVDGQARPGCIAETLTLLAPQTEG